MMITTGFNPLPLLGAILLVALPLIGADANYQPKPLQIGMAKSFLTEQPKSFVDVAADDFMDVMKKTTGLEGQVATKHTAIEVADKLSKKQLDFGIFHGHEFAWVQKKHPDFQPLLIAASKPAVSAYLIVH